MVNGPDDVLVERDGQRWADVIDLLTMYPDARRRVVQVLTEIGVSGWSTKK